MIGFDLHDLFAYHEDERQVWTRCATTRSALNPMTTNSGGEPESYEKILFRRDGGGNKTFYVTVDNSLQQLSFEVVRYNFKETAFVFQRPLPESRDVFGLVASILSGQTSLTGGAAPSARQTGTWVHLYAVTPQGSTVEITDHKLSAKLMALESIVEAESSEFPASR